MRSAEPNIQLNRSRSDGGSTSTEQGWGKRQWAISPIIDAGDMHQKCGVLAILNIDRVLHIMPERRTQQRLFRQTTSHLGVHVPKITVHGVHLTVSFWRVVLCAILGPVPVVLEKLHSFARPRSSRFQSVVHLPVW